jgi:hypothetical protein
MDGLFFRIWWVAFQWLFLICIIIAIAVLFIAGTHTPSCPGFGNPC